MAKLDEPFYLIYTDEVLSGMPRVRYEVFCGPLKKYVISTERLFISRMIRFSFYQDHFLEAVEKWPWLLCRNVGECLIEQEYGEYAKYEHAIQGMYGKWKKI